MRIANYIILVFLSLSVLGCVKELYDDDDFTLSNGGKCLSIYISSGESLKQKTESIDLTSIEKIILSGKIAGENLAFLRKLSGGDDFEFLGGRKLGYLDMSDVSFQIGDEVYYTRGDEKLKIENSRDVPAYAFEYSYVLNTVVFPDYAIGAKYKIKRGAFKDCLLLRYVDWGTQISEIEDEAFMNCSTLAFGEVLVFPEGLSKIGDYAFKETHPNDVDLPSSITLIGNEAFSQILGNVTIRSNVPPIISESSFIFYKNSKRKLFVPAGAVERYKIEPYLTVFSEIKAL